MKNYFSFALLITLSMCILSCSDSTTNSTAGKIKLSSQKATMVINTQRVFHAEVENYPETQIIWSLSPADGGDISTHYDNYIIFTAPDKTGIVNLIATSKDDPGLQGTIQITVVEEAAETVVIFNNGNIAGVQSGPQNPTEFEITESWEIAYMNNYHYFNNGQKPGMIGLKHEDGTVYGPWQTVGRVGQGNVSDAYWECWPNVVIKPGKYTVTDSHPETWSHNSGSNYCGFTQINAYAK